jgi:hypothetical protein
VERCRGRGGHRCRGYRGQYRSDLVGADSAIEVTSAAGLLWRLRKAGPHATVSEDSAAANRALYVVAITFFLLAIYITWEAVKSLISREEPIMSPVGSSWPYCR